MRSLLVIIALLAAMCAASAQAADQLMWQIGKADNNYEEFAIAHDYNSYLRDFSKPKPFDPARDDAAKSWPFIQPGPSDAWAGQREHPLTVAFEAGNQPTGICTLTVDMVDTHAGGPPVYEISINGKSGRFSLPSGGGDESLTDPAKGKEYVLAIPFPASFLKSGQNQITMTIVEGSWLLFDYLSLSNSPDSQLPAPSVKHLSVTPTIRFVQDGGKLKQVIEMSAEFSPGSPTCSAVVKVDGTSETITVEPGLMGTVQRELYVDEITKPTTAEVSVNIGGKTETAVCDLKPQRHWRLYVQASNHVDIGYTNYQERIAALHNDNMSRALGLCKEYPDFKFNTEAAWVEDNFLTMMPADKKTEFIKYAKSGQLGCQTIYGNMLTGICSHESFIRDLYYARNMSRKYGIPYDMAMTSDVPTQVWTLPTVLAGAGIKYLSSGLNLDRGYTFKEMFDKSPFYWQGPDGASVLTWFSRGYAQATRLHLYDGATQAEVHVRDFLKGFDRPDYPYDAVLAFGGQGDNQPMNPGLAPTVSEWNKKYAYPQIILCRGPEFFQYIEANFKDRVPIIRGDGGVYWEDGAGSSANETAMVRRAKETLAAAEKLSAFNTVMGSAGYPKVEIEQGWKNSILYDEHTWGAAQSISQPDHEQTIHQWAVKSGFAAQSDARAKEAQDKSVSALAGLLKLKKPSVVVYNPLSWPVSDWVMAIGDGSASAVYAQDVPPLGYKIFPVPSNQPLDKSLPPGTGIPVLENRYYKMIFDSVTGSVKSLYDKELKRELVDPKQPYGLNQYIYTIGRRNGPTVADMKDVTRDSNTPAPVFSRHHLDVGQSMRVRGSAKNASEWVTAVILYDKTKRIDFVNMLQKQETLEKEAGYFAFPFALNKPEWYLELPDGVVKPKTQMLPGADMQWYCSQDFAAASDARGAVVWTAVDSPLITLGDINRETFKSPQPIENGHLYAYVFNNYWHTNYKASQGGQMMFRFSLTSMPKYDAVAAARFGQSVRNPLTAQIVQPNPKGRVVAASGSLCSVSAPNVVVQAVKRAESGKGLVIRLRELVGTRTQTVVTLSAGKFKEAWSCNLVEDPKTKLALTGGKVKVVVPAHGMATVLLR